MDGVTETTRKIYLDLKIKTMEIPVFISRCLTYGIKIYPFQQKRIFEAYETHKIPDKELELFDADKMNKYVNALDLINREDSRDWKRGSDILEELGFRKQNVIRGHRSFITMFWNSLESQE